MNSFFAKILVALSCASVPMAALAADHPRPKITGISHIAVYASDPAQAKSFYAGVLGCSSRPDLEERSATRYSFNSHQWVEVLPLPADAGINRLDHIAFVTRNTVAMRQYLASNGFTVPTSNSTATDRVTERYPPKD